MRKAFERAVTALCHSFIRERYGARAGEPGPAWERMVRFVLDQQARMPDYLRLPFAMATLAFDYGALLTSGRPFYRLAPERRWTHIERARRLGPFGDLVRFYEGLSVFAFGEELQQSEPAQSRPTARAVDHASGRVRDRYEIVVIGSGPGGAITACLLAEAGRDVLLIESGPFLAFDDALEFTRAEMEAKYRNGGITAAFGRTKIAYVEGHVVGGGSEINAGLYHRTPEDILERWRREYRLDAATPAELQPYFEANEHDVSVSYLPGDLPAASLKLHQGAQSKGWKSFEVPRVFRYEPNVRTGAGHKQSMTRTFIPRALNAGCTLLPETRVRRLTRSGSQWMLRCEPNGANSARARDVRADTVFVCAGAIQTPALLLASGIGSNVGRSLRMHPTVKVVAQFPDQINRRDLGVTVHQVKEFAPRLSFGVSISRPPYLSLAMLDHPADKKVVDEHWSRMAIYYAMITGGNGRVRPVPFHRDPLVSYALGETDLRNLADGLKKMCEALFAAGAEVQWPTVAGYQPLRHPAELDKLPELLPAGRANLMTVHLFSSCPMGEDRSKCVADSFGEVHGHDNLYIADASLLCTAPGVNPQGSIMAFVRRNALRFLKR
jgi:choline dehydrogenase-like flavoprotein